MEGDQLNYSEYFDSLLAEMRLLNGIKSRQPNVFAYTARLLSAEISRVWKVLSGEALPAPQSVHLEEKIYMPEKVDSRGRSCKLIGRILGPCGLSVKQMEAEIDCQILIRGRGSVKDAVKEASLIGNPGFEHLDEPLHVLVKAEGRNETNAREKLSNGVRAIKKLFNPRFDDYKKKQLVTHAIISGTYRADYGRKGNK